MPDRSSEINNVLNQAVSVATGQPLGNTTLSERDDEDAVFLLHCLVMLDDTLASRNDGQRFTFFVAACGTKHVLPVVRKITFPSHALSLKAYWREGVSATVARLDEGYGWNAIGHGVKLGRDFVVQVWKTEVLTNFAETLGVKPHQVPVTVTKVFLKAEATEKPYFYLLASDELTFKTYLVQSRYRLPGTSCAHCAAEETANKPKFRRCGNCRTTLYCGKECQAADWGTGHREQCKAHVEAEKMGIFRATTGTSNSNRKTFIPSIVVDASSSKYIS